LYGAIGGVAAITTALQSLVALLPLRSALDIRRIKTGSAPRQSAYVAAAGDASRDFFVFLALNVVAAIINGAVLAAWWKVGVSAVTVDLWEYWVPWTAVVVGSAVLFLTALGSLIGLGILAWRN
jgi:hypothetical protein